MAQPAWSMKASFEAGPGITSSKPAKTLDAAFRDLKRFMGRYPDAAEQTRPVNEAFYKASIELAKGIRKEYRAQGIGKIVKDKRTGRKRRKTGALYDAIQAKRGKARWRPSAMLFAGGGKGSRHRWLIEGGFHPGFGGGDIYVEGKPYVAPGIEKAMSKAVSALRKHIEGNFPAIAREANRIATRG